MSLPHNILGKFRSYAYHHILLVCNNTATADAIAETTDVTAYQHPRDPKLRYQKRVLSGNNEHQYITLIDGTTDARFYITDATWENIIAMEDYVGDGNIPQSTSMSLEGELSLMEPLGANFLNVLTDCCDFLETDPVGLVFLLKTIFIGHRDDGTIESIPTIKPLLFMNYDITAIFDSSGAKYTMSFVGLTNGLAKMPQVQQAVSGFNYTIDSEKTLKETFEDVSKQINESYLGFKAKAQADFAKTLYIKSKDGINGAIQSGTAVANSIAAFDDRYRDVKYSIIADEYDKPEYTAGTNTNDRQESSIDDAVLNFGTSVGVETIIKKILATSQGVIDDAKVGEDGKRYVYKIVSGLVSTAESFVIEYHIKKYEMIMMPFEAAFNGEEYKPADGQFIEFDYIFTGNNVDVKEFDIKMEMGMAFFQIASTTETTPTQKTVQDGIKSEAYAGTGNNQVASKNRVKRTKTPLFLGTKLTEPMARNTRNPVDSATFQALINRQAALENIEAKMTIYGNPQLLNEMQVQPNDLANPEIEDPIKDETVNPKWMNVPSLVKVNIKMPVDTNDLNTEYTDFWYTGYYTLFAVKHIFSGGVFTQELDMLSMPVADELDDKTDDKSKTEPTKPTKEQIAAAQAADNKIFDEIDARFAVQSPDSKPKADDISWTQMSSTFSDDGI